MVCGIPYTRQLLLPFPTKWKKSKPLCDQSHLATWCCTRPIRGRLRGGQVFNTPGCIQDARSGALETCVVVVGHIFPHSDYVCLLVTLNLNLHCHNCICVICRTGNLLLVYSVHKTNLLFSLQFVTTLSQKMTILRQKF